jgi:hypothetical protein
MKRLCLAMSLATLMVAPRVFAGYDGTVTLTEVGGNDNGGGLFKAVTTGDGTFDTFCLSIATTFSPGVSYYYNNSSTIAANGIPPASAYIATGTAYLYRQFLAGNANYAGVANANAVQATIWYLQGDLNGMIDPEDSHDLSGYINSILPGLETASGLSLAQLQADGGGIYGVRAMNLYAALDGNGNPTGVSQPQLTAVPEPTTMIAGALLLLPFGASAARIMRKKVRA